MKTISEILVEMDNRKKERQSKMDLLSRMVNKYGFIESGFWIKGHQMSDFDLANGYLPNQIYKVMQDSYPDTFVFYAHYSPTENAFFDIDYYENSKWIDVDGMICTPVFINCKNMEKSTL